MPRVSISTDYLLDRYYKIPSLITNVSDDELSILSPNVIDEILSRKLYEQLKATTRIEKGLELIDPELINLIDRFFNLTYQNTIPMVNLLATAQTNFLQENIRELDNKLQEQQTTHMSVNIKRGTSLLYQFENDEDDDDNLSWASAPT